MNACFITGTDTGVGKTLITGLLARYLLSKGINTITQKWIQTGASMSLGDIEIHLKLTKIRRREILPYIDHILPYNLKFPASPHLAADAEGVKISEPKIKKSFSYLKKNFDYTLVEGVGGVLVPLSRRRLVIDTAADLKLPVIIVAENKLGAINHTLLTIEAIKKRKMPIFGIIFNSKNARSQKKIIEDNPKVIAQISKERILGSLPYCSSSESLYKAFIPIGAKAYSLQDAFYNTL
ncbi:dethiobiotin synthase [Candidatus Omnitrophota bacterium]